MTTTFIFFLDHILPAYFQLFSHLSPPWTYRLAELNSLLVLRKTERSLTIVGQDIQRYKDVQSDIQQEDPKVPTANCFGFSRCGEVIFLNVACGPEKSDHGRFITKMAMGFWDLGYGTPNFFASEKLATSGILLR